MRTFLVGILLLVASIPAQAQQPTDRDLLHEHAWERVLARLEALPDRWNQLPAQAVPASGRLSSTVIDDASKIERDAADTLFSRLVRTPARARASLLAEARGQRTLTEVDLWWPGHVLRQQRLRSLDEAGLTIEAWLDLAEHLGRRDVLLRVAGVALDLAHRATPTARLDAVARRWSALPPGPHGLSGAAAVIEAHGNILASTGQNDDARLAYRRARRLYRSSGDKLGEGYTWIGEAHVLGLFGRGNDALRAYRQALGLFRDLGDKRGQAHAWEGEYRVLALFGQYRDALKANRQARSLFTEADDRGGQAYTWLAEAQMLELLGQHDGARGANRHARDLFMEVGDQRGQAYTWTDEAQALALIGRNDGALAAYRQARSLFVDVGFELGQGQTWEGEASVLVHLEQYDGALAAYRRARRMFENEGHELGQGGTWRGEADVLLYLGRYDGALHAYREARSLFVAVGHQLGQGHAWAGEADVMFHLGRNQDALEAYRRARSLSMETGDRRGQVYAWHGEARVLLRMDGFGPALRAAGDAARLARDVMFIPGELDARMLEAHILLASKQESRALHRAEEALALLRRWRQTGVSDLDRTAMCTVEMPHDLLIPLLARKGGPAVEKTLALAEEAHAPVLLDLLSTGPRRPDDTGDPSLLDERNRLQHRLAEIGHALQDTIAPGQRRELLRDRAALDSQLELNELIALGSLGSPLVNGTPIDARTRDELVRDVGPILLYYVAANETVAFLLQPDRRTPVVHRIGLSRGQLQRDVRALRQAIANPPWEQAAREQQRALFDRLVAPFADALAETPRLTIIPHGPLHELPFEALLDARGVPLFARWHLTVTPSLSVLHTLRQRRATRQPSPRENAFLGIAAGTGLSLPYREVDQASTWFGPTARIIGQQSNSRTAYTDLAPDARHILISSHGKHVAQSRSGYVELSGPDGVATRLTAGEIAHVLLRAELVTLAACETARGEAMQSDERLDLTRAFLIAGADAVLATRWRLPEHPSTRQFLLDFYQALHQGGPGGTPLRKDEALTEARRRSLARGDHAQLWAAWVLVGDAR